MKTGLVLEGGAMRGIYTAGVLDVFMEENIVVDGVIGVSAGSVHGSGYIAKQKGRSIRYIKKYCMDWHFMSVRSMVTTGDMVGRKFSYEEIPYKLDPFDFESFLKSEIPFYAVATNLETGKAEYLRATGEKSSLEMIRASSSMPIVSHIVELNGKKYLDGGTADSIPIRAFIKMGYEKNIVVLTQPKGFRKKPEKLMPIIRKKYKAYPEYIKACEERCIKYNRTLKYLERLEKEGKVLIIRPSRKIAIKRAEKNPEVIQKQYDLGRRDAKKALRDIKRFIQK